MVQVIIIGPLSSSVEIYITTYVLIWRGTLAQCYEDGNHLLRLQIVGYDVSISSLLLDL